jgi:hypothetical protein
VVILIFFPISVSKLEGQIGDIHNEKEGFMMLDVKINKRRALMKTTFDTSTPSLLVKLFISGRW